MIVGCYWKCDEERAGFLSEINKELHHLTFPQIDIFFSENSAPCFSDDCRLVFGNVFNKSYKIASDEEIQLSFANFASNFWGQYFFISISDHIISILRSPDGVEPLFYATTKSGSIIFSTDIEYITKFVKPLFNWDYMCSFVAIGSSPKEKTAFQNIKELQFGCQLNITSGSLDVVMNWNPYDAYKSSFKNANHQIESISQTLLNVIRCELDSYKYKNIYIDFSGGLDSTAVLFCLREAIGSDVPVKAVNVYNKDVSSSNELEHARKIAKRCNVELVEFESSNCLPFSPYKKLTNVPFAPDSGFMRIGREQVLCESIGIGSDDILFTGQGGDHVFMCPPARESLVDVLVDKNFSLFHKKLEDLATINRVSFFRLLKISCNYLFKYFCGKYEDICSMNARKPAWFVGEISPDICRGEYPFYKQKQCIPPGKYYQNDAINIGLTEMCTDIRAYGLLHRCQVMNPLFSKPIIELGLSIPTYELYNDEYDRILFRQSIADRFDTQHVWRKDKGDVTGELLLGLATHKKHVLEMCCEGEFAQMGLLNKDLLYNDIKCASQGRGMDFQLHSIINLYCAESFMKHWKFS